MDGRERSNDRRFRAGGPLFVRSCKEVEAENLSTDRASGEGDRPGSKAPRLDAVPVEVCLSQHPLTPAQSERLAILAEECGEVVQAIGKILRHGYDSYDPTKTNGPDNRKSLENEIGDICYAVALMVKAKDVNQVNINASEKRKAEKARRYTHHQQGLV